jgi:hypothetical protein
LATRHNRGKTGRPFWDAGAYPRDPFLRFRVLDDLERAGKSSAAAVAARIGVPTWSATKALGRLASCRSVAHVVEGASRRPRGTVGDVLPIRRHFYRITKAGQAKLRWAEGELGFSASVGPRGEAR